jgi:DHA1 family bicyclomycin/chloramphenicol resistance-like MFS transporter
MGMSIVPMMGPAVGVLDEAFGWQASFWMLAGGGLMLFILLYFDQGRHSQSAKVDLAHKCANIPSC